MADTINSLDQLSSVAPAVAASTGPVYVQKLDAQGRAYATGKRKNAIARVWIKPGSGKIIVNGKEFNAFFARPVLQMILQQPIVAAARKDQYDVNATVSGGGLSGQAGAVRHGISKALTYFEPELRGVLKKVGSSPATAASSNARSTARPRPAGRSSSPSAKALGAGPLGSRHCEGAGQRPFSLRLIFVKRLIS